MTTVEKKAQNPLPFPQKITEYDQYLFAQATNYDIYNKLGSHLTEKDGVKGVYFAVWAPKAKSVSLVGNFNNWDGSKHIMTRNEPNGIYDIFVEGLDVGEIYKYQITTFDNRVLMKADPYANMHELRPNNASIVSDISKFKWNDTKWINARKKADVKKSPLAIYEVHIGSWKRHEEVQENGTNYYNYREFAHEIVDYVKEMGYTHVELMGIAEHPFDGSWGYQVTGYYAPTSRYGTPEDFMYMIDYLHQNKIGVILDWVPAHFPRDGHGLAKFDGTAVYEYADPKKGEHPDWGTMIFDFGKNEVKNFLIANALFWIEKMHLDGLRVDAVASMLYLDYGKQTGQWIANKYGGNKNLEAIEFFKHINTCIIGRNPGVMMIAEESTAWPRVTGDPKDDGLGFTFKWNMGWMHDFLDYMKLDPLFRKFNHNKMTFSMMYAYSENFILVLSHDEVVHLKCSMLNKMPGYPDDKFKNLKAGYAFMMGHPGKKLLFMGQDFGQLREWSEERELDWFLLDEANHANLKAFYRDLLHIYNSYPVMYKMDNDPKGFMWINADDGDRSIFSFVRLSPTKKKNLLFVINFTPMERSDYRVGVPNKRTYKLILDSEDPKYGGSASEDKIKEYKAEKVTCDNQKFSFAYSLPAYGVAVFEF